jgi:segregation and condensation protein B
MSKSDKDNPHEVAVAEGGAEEDEAADDAAESEEGPTDDVFGGGAEFGVPDEDDADEDELVMHDADAEDAEEERERLRESLEAMREGADDDGEVAPGGGPREMAELMSIIEALVFVSDEPLTVKVAGGWQFATRPEHHEHVRAFLKSKPSAKLSLAALETLAVIAYKQPVTVPEILEIRGVTSSSAIKTLLDKRLIIAKGRKETVGRPMMYGTSKEFLMQFGLRDLGELPSIEDFEDLTGGAE